MFIFEDSKEVTKSNNMKTIRSCNYKKVGQCIGQNKNVKKTNSNLQNITHKTKELLTGTLLKMGVNSYSPEAQA
jgi:hypothetical protein